PAIVQADLGIAGQFEVSRRGAMVDDLEHAYFRIDIGCDACRPGQFDVIGTTAEFRAIAEKGMFVEIVRPQNRLVADRPELVVRPSPHVAELAPAIARAVLLPAGHVHLSPGSVTGAGGGEEDVIGTVGKQTHGMAWNHFMPRAVTLRGAARVA